MRTRTERGARRGRSIPAIAAALLICAPAGLSAEGWCDLMFKDVLDAASSVIVADYRQSGKSSPRIRVTEVLKGSCSDDDLDLDFKELAAYDLKDGDRLVLALTAFGQPVRVVPGMGGCTAVSVLPIRGGKLRARDRTHYDFRGKSMTLEALRAELLVLLRPAS